MRREKEGGREGGRKEGGGREGGREGEERREGERDERSENILIFCCSGLTCSF